MNAVPQLSDDNDDLYKYLFHYLEAIHVFRFLFQIMAKTSTQYAAINRKLKRLVTIQRQHLRTLLCAQQHDGRLKGASGDIDLLLEFSHSFGFSVKVVYFR